MEREGRPIDFVSGLSRPGNMKAFAEAGAPLGFVAGELSAACEDCPACDNPYDEPDMESQVLQCDDCGKFYDENQGHFCERRDFRATGNGAV
jgi:hypothetical protein